MDKIQIFISYRREGGDALAGRISDRLTAMGYRVFFDMETMHSGKFNDQIVEAIKQCEDMLLILPPHGLDRCSNPNDWVRNEIQIAMEHHKRIIPVLMRGFTFPESLPPEINDIRYIEGIAVVNEYFDAMMQKIVDFLSCSQKKNLQDAYADGSIVSGRYQILRKLGQGSSAEVYLATDIAMNMQVAIKRMRRQQYVDFKAVKEQAEREFHVQKMCIHSGISVVRSCFETDDEFAIVMDYIDGENLAALISERGFLSEPEVLEWAIQICSALHYLHTKPNPLFLRDIKPSNIIINTSGEAILIDFGTAQSEDTFHDYSTIALGTAGYAAPEQYAGKGDARTDIFNLGMTLYHALTGRGPLEPPYYPVPVRTIRKELSKDIEQVIEKCVERNPEKRYATAGELKADLETIVAKSHRTTWFKKLLQTNRRKAH